MYHCCVSVCQPQCSGFIIQYCLESCVSMCYRQARQGLNGKNIVFDIKWQTGGDVDIGDSI